jgi:ribosome maturation factor RimP
LVDANAIERLIEPSLHALGYRIVRVALSSSATLQVMAERLDDVPMSLDDCVLISHSVSALLDVADPIAGAYRLEISSPGIDRPLVKPADYDRFNGCEAKIELTLPLRGRRRFRGRLLGIIEGTVRLATAAGEERLPLVAVARANLVAGDSSAARPARDRTRRAAPAAARSLTEPPHQAVDPPVSSERSGTRRGAPTADLADASTRGPSTRRPSTRRPSTRRPLARRLRAGVREH